MKCITKIKINRHVCSPPLRMTNNNRRMILELFTGCLINIYDPKIIHQLDNKYGFLSRIFSMKILLRYRYFNTYFTFSHLQIFARDIEINVVWLSSALNLMLPNLNKNTICKCIWVLNIILKLCKMKPIIRSPKFAGFSRYLSLVEWLG